MKKFVFTALLISSIVTGFVVVSLGNSGMAVPNERIQQTLAPVDKLAVVQNFSLYGTNNIDEPTPTPTSTIVSPPTNTPEFEKPNPTQKPIESAIPSNTPNSNDLSSEPIITQTNSPTNTPLLTPSADPSTTPPPTPIITPSPSPPMPSQAPLPLANATNSSSPSPTPKPSTSPVQSSFQISGYILDANGRGIAGAEIIFCVPSIVPSVHSDFTGHYVIYAPAGVYHVIVWPPYDSNYIQYDWPVFVVGEDTLKNITLNTGYKISGYITDYYGTPVSGAVVSLNGFFSGYYSNYMGYFFVVAPAGTYKLSVVPRSGYSFPSYFEEGFVVNGTATKNISLRTPAFIPTPTPGPTPTSP